MRRLTSIVAAAALGVLFAQTPARGGVPRVMSFQGRLSHADGGAVADGDYSVAFRIYGQETGGAPLWEETQTVSVADGLCSVLLGVVTPLSPAFDAQYWLAVEVESDGEMTPRFRLAAAPYALRAEDADSVGGLSAGELLDKATYDSDGDGKADSAEVAGDADTVDGKHAAELADAAHNHDAAYLNVTGDAMTGALTLSGDPVGDLEAATKQYVDNTVTTAGNDYVKKAGDTMTGALNLSADPTSATQAATKQYVDNTVTTAGGAFVKKSGDTMSGDLSLGGNQLTNVRVDVLTDAPEAASAANEGRVYYNLTLKRLEYSNGTEWVPVGPGRTIRATPTAVPAANAATQVNNEIGAEYRVATAFEALALLSVKGTSSLGTGIYWVEGADPIGSGDDDDLFTTVNTSNCPSTAFNCYWALEVKAGGRLVLGGFAMAENHKVLAIEKE